MVKSLQIICSISLSIIALSFFYYFIIRPIQKDQPLKECLKTAEDVRVRMDEVAKRNPLSGLNSIEIFSQTEKAKEDCYKKY
ncbi:MAG: hypothetical protein AAB598_01980 [Patescibacteria group bacterium]